MYVNLDPCEGFNFMGKINKYDCVIDYITYN